MKPLFNIKAQKFNWIEQVGAEQSYRQIFHSLVSSDAFLNFPTPGVVMELATDASNFSIGSILFQVMEGKVKY